MTEDVKLVNENYGEKQKEHLLEQYKMFVNTSLSVTSKRLETNKFHLTLNSIIVGIAGLLSILNPHAVVIIISFVGIVISIVWHMSILAYKELNSAKFKVINELETYMPACLFKCEEKHYLKKYHGVTSTEKLHPLIFIGLYIAIIILIVYGYFS